MVSLLIVLCIGLLLWLIEIRRTHSGSENFLVYIKRLLMILGVMCIVILLLHICLQVTAFTLVKQYLVEGV